MWFQDEARFGQQGTLTRVWARTGSRPVAVRQHQHANLYVFTAVCPGDGRACGLLSPSVNTGTMQAFLDQLASDELAPDEHAVMILDRATWHTTEHLRVPLNITLLLLPPLSPELNPVENLWHYLRSHHWSNRSYADLAAVRQAAAQGWRAVCLDPSQVRSICAAPYLRERGI